MTRRSLGEHLLDLLIHLYPPSFREAFGDDLRTTFIIRLRAARDRRGRLGVLIFLVREVPDIMLAALRERQLTLRQLTPRQPARTGRSSIRPGGSMLALLHDLRQAVRTLATKNRGLAIVSLSTLALGIGATTAIMSVVKGVLLDPLPFPQPDRLVRIYQQSGHGANHGFLSAPNVVALRDQASTFEAIGSFNDYSPAGIDLTSGGRAERLEALKVSSDFFVALATPPLFGRVFTRDEEVPPGALERDPERFTISSATPPVTVISHGLWTRHFDADPNAVGQTIELDGAAVSVVGIMPRDFGRAIGVDADLWFPLDLATGGQNTHGNNYLSAVGRLRPGVDLEQAQAELDTVSDQLAEAYPQYNEDISASLVPLVEDLVGDSRRMLAALLAAGGLVLLVCAMNVANLLLVRGLGREREMAVRSAIGASRLSLVVAGGAEGLVISLAGGLAGLVLAVGGIELLAFMGPDVLPRFDSISLDAPVLLFAWVATLLIGLLFSITPGWRAIRLSGLRATVRSGNSPSSSGLRRVQSLLVVSQVAGALVLLVGGGLLVRSFAALQEVELGFESAGVNTFRIRLPDYRYGEAEERLAFYRRLHDRLGTLPGVRATAATSKLPADGHRNNWGFGTESHPLERGTRPATAEIRCVDGNVLDALGIEILRGRGLTPADRSDSEPVVLVTRDLVKRYFLDTEALGTSLFVGGQARTIVGIIGDLRTAHRDRPEPQIFIPHEQFAADRNWDLTFVVATHGATETGAAGTELISEATIRQTVRELDPLLAVYDVRPLHEITAIGVARSSFATLLMSTFAAVAMLLAALGIYGTLSYGVRQRLGEIGIRKALGAQAGSVLRLVLRQGLTITLAGIGLGTVGALVLGRLLDSFLYEVRGSDLTTLATTAFLVFGVAATASFLPARHAAAIDPAAVLREE